MGDQACALVKVWQFGYSVVLRCRNIRRTQCAKQYRPGFRRSTADEVSLLLGLGHGDLAIHRVCGNPFERIYTRPLGLSRALLVATDCDAAPQVYIVNRSFSMRLGLRQLRFRDQRRGGRRWAVRAAGDGRAAAMPVDCSGAILLGMECMRAIESALHNESF